MLPSLIGHAAVVTVAIVCWLDAADHTQLSRVSGFGLAPALPVTYYLSVLILGGGFVYAVSRSAPNAVLALYTFALVVMLHGIAPLTYPEPRYAWTYKHLGVTAYIAQNGYINRSIDIYQNWPGFFALNAWLSRATGVSALTYAPWAEVFFNATYVPALLFVTRGLTRDRRLLWSTAWFFVLANWIGQDYYSPQGFVFLLGLLLLGLCLRCAPAPRPARNRLTRWLVRLQGERAVPWIEAPGAGPLQPRVALVVGGLIFSAIAISHQLSPFLLIVAVAALAITTRRIPGLAVGAMLVLAAGWVVPALPLLESKFKVFEFSPFDTPRPPGYNPALGLRGIQVASYASAAVIVAMVALAALGYLRRRRAGYWDVPLVAAGVAPLFVLAGVSYSGEGLLRIYLFGLPWLCFFAATACLPGPQVRRGRALYALRMAVASVAIGGVFVFAFFGREKINLILPQDVAVERWYELHAPAGSGVTYLAPNVPNRLTSRYARLQVPGGSFGPAVTFDPSFRGHPLGAGDLPNLERTLVGMEARAAFFMVSPSQTNYVSLFGVLPPGSVQSLVAAVSTSPDFTLVFRARGALLFRLVSTDLLSRHESSLRPVAPNRLPQLRPRGPSSVKREFTPVTRRIYRLQRCLKLISPSERIVLLMSGLSVRSPLTRGQIASRLNISAAAVERLWVRGLHDLDQESNRHGACRLKAR